MDDRYAYIQKIKFKQPLTDKKKTKLKPESLQRPMF